MTTCVNYHRIAGDCYSGNACNVSGTLCSWRADANGVGFGRTTSVPDIDIVIARREVGPGAKA
jgi:hypothetical protein